MFVFSTTKEFNNNGNDYENYNCSLYTTKYYNDNSNSTYTKTVHTKTITATKIIITGTSIKNFSNADSNHYKNFFKYS